MHKKLLNKILPIALSVAMTVQMTPESVLAAEMDGLDQGNAQEALQIEDGSTMAVTSASDSAITAVEHLFTFTPLDTHVDIYNDTVTPVSNVNDGKVVDATKEIAIQAEVEKGYKISEISVSGLVTDAKWSETSGAAISVADGITLDNGNQIKTITIAENQIKNEKNTVAVQVKTEACKTGALTVNADNCIVSASDKEEGIDVTNDFTFTVVPDPAMTLHEKVSVKVYYNGATSGTELTPDDEGVYTITSDELIKHIGQQVTISASIENQHSIQFNFNKGVTVTSATGAGITTGSAISVDDKKEFKFKVEAEKDYDLKSVKWGVMGEKEPKGVLHPDSNGYYTAPNVKDDIYIGIESRKKGIRVRFINNQYKDGVGYPINYGIINGYWDKVNGLLFPFAYVNDTFKFKLIPFEGYVVESVKVGSVPIEPDAPGEYSVASKEEALEINYDVARIIPVYSTKDMEVKLGGETIKNGEEIEASFTATQKLVVTMQGEKANKLLPLLNGVAGKPTGKTNEYEFDVDPKATSLKFSTMETIKPEQYTVTVSASSTNSTINYKYLSVKNNKVEKGNDIAFTVTSKTGYEVHNVSYKIGGKEVTIKPVNGIYTIPAASITGDVEIIAKSAYIGKESNTVTFVTNGFNIKVGDKTVTSYVVKKGESLTFSVEAPDKSNLELDFIGTNTDKASAITNGSTCTITPTHDTILYVVAKKATNNTITGISTVPNSNTNLTSSVSSTVKYDTKVDGSYAETLTDNTQIEDGKTVYFKVTGLTTYQKVEKVTYGTNALEPEKNATIATSDKGSFVPTEDGIFTVFVTLDESNASVHKLDLSVSGGKVKVVKDGKEIKDGYLTTESSTKLVVTADPGYEVKKITPSDEKAVKVDGNKVDVTYGTNTSIALDIVADLAKVSDRFDGIQIKNSSADYFTCKVSADSADYDNNYGTYTIRTNVKTFDFTITAKNGKVPVVEFGGNEIEAKVSGNTYSYSIPATLFSGINNVISISEKAQTSPLRFIDDGNVTYKVTVNGVDLTNQDEYYWPEIGDKVRVTATANDNFIISDVTQKIAGKSSKVSANTKKYEFSYTVTKDAMTVLVETNELTGVAISDGIKTDYGKDGVYTLSFDKNYTAKVMTGLNQKDVADIKVVGSDIATQVTLTSNAAVFTLNKKDSGKTFTLNFYDKKSTDADAKVIGTATIVVPTLVTSVVIGDGTDATVAPGSVNEYKVKVPDGATLMNGENIIPVCDKSGFAASMSSDNKELTVIASTKVGEVATIKLYRGDTKTTENLIGQIKVTTDASSVTNAVVVPELIAATDTELYIGINGPKELPAIKNGKYFYEVTYTTEDGKSTLVTGPYYAAYDKGGYTKALVKVDSATQGKGEPHNYSVSVKLVQMSSTTASKSNIIAESKASKEVQMSTRKAYYEDNLKVKQTVKRIFTGQTVEDAIIPVFSQKASFIKVKAEDVTEGLVGRQLLSFSTDETANATGIGVTANTNTYHGTHKIKITAQAAEGMNATTTFVEMNVVRGIEKIDLSGPSEVYKPAGKKATVQLTTVINDLNNDKKVDKNEKAKVAKVEYSIQNILDKDGNSIKEKCASSVTVSASGKVTIAPKANDAIRTIVVLAKAKDYEDNNCNVTHNIIVKSEAAEIGNLVIVDAKDNVIVSGSKSSVTADKLNGAYLKVLKEDTKTKDVYSDSDYSDVNVVYSSNNKGITIDSTGRITVKKVTKDTKVAFTVTAEDGSKKTKKLTQISVGFTKVAELGLELVSGDSNREGDGTITNFTNNVLSNDIKYNANGARTFGIYLMEKATKDADFTYAGKTEEYGYTIKVEGAKVIRTDDNGHATEIVVNGAKATITLKDLSTGAKKVYTVENTAFSKKPAPKVSVVGQLTAGTITPTADKKTYNREVTVKAKTNAKYAFVKIDPVARDTANDKKDDRYDSFADALNGSTSDKFTNGAVVDVENGEFTLAFAKSPILAGNYKIQITYGNEVRDDGTLVASNKTTSAIIKAVAPVKAEAKLNKKYKMSLADATSVKLTFAKRNKGVGNVTFDEVLNANMEGQPNAFGEIFSVSEDGILSMNAKNTKLTELLADANNLTGYVKYTVYDLNGNGVTQTEKVQISIVESAGVYKATDIIVAKGMTSAKTKILLNGKPITMKDVEIESKNGIVATLAKDNKTIELTEIPAKQGTYKVNFTFSPEDTLVSGTKVTIKAVVKVNKGMNVGKIVLNDTSIDLSDVTTATRKSAGKEGYYVPTDGKGNTGYYTTNVKYEMKTFVDLTKLSIASSDSAVVVENDAENSQLVLKIYRSSVTGKKEINPTLTIGFEDPSMKKEKVALSIKMPEAVPSFQDIMSKGNAALDALELKTTAASLNTGSPQTIDNVDKAIIGAFKEATGLTTSATSLPATFKCAKDKSSEMTVEIKATKNFVIPSNAKGSEYDGAAFLTITYTNNAEASDSKNKTVEVKKEYVIKYGTVATVNELRDYDFKVKGKNGSGKAQIATNSTTAQDVIADLTSFLKLSGGDRLFVYNVVKEAATDAAPGQIKFDARIVGKKGEQKAYRQISVTIAQLRDVPFIVAAINGITRTQNIRPTEEAVKSFVKEEFTKAATYTDSTTNTKILYSDIEYKFVALDTKDADGKDVKQDVVFNTAKTTATFKLQIWNKKSAVDRDKIYETDEITLTLNAAPSYNNVVTSLQTKLSAILNGTEPVTSGEKTARETNTSEAFVKAIDKAIAEAVGISDVVVTKDISFTPAQYTGKYVNGEELVAAEANGKIKVILTVTGKNGTTDTTTYVYTTSSNVTSGAASTNAGDYTLLADNDFQTAEMLVADIQAAVRADLTKDSGSTLRGRNVNVESALQTIIAGCDKDDSEASVELVVATIATKAFTSNDKDITYVAPTAKTNGRIKANIIVRTYDASNNLIETKVCAIDEVIGKLSSTPNIADQKEDAIVALEAFFKARPVTNEDNTEKGIEALKEAVENVVKQAVSSGTNVIVDEFDIHDSTVGRDGKVIFTITIGTAGTKIICGSDTHPNDTSVTIKKLDAPENLDEAVDIVLKEVARRYLLSTAPDAKSLATEINAYLGDGYSIVPVGSYRSDSFKKADDGKTFTDTWTIKKGKEKREVAVTSNVETTPTPAP